MADALSVVKILELPAAVDIVTAGKALGCGRTKIHEMARSGELEEMGLPLLRLGTRYRVRRSDLLRLLDIADVSGDSAAEIE